MTKSAVWWDAEDVQVTCTLFTTINEDQDEIEGCNLTLTDVDGETLTIYGRPWHMENLGQRILAVVDNPQEIEF